MLGWGIDPAGGGFDKGLKLLIIHPAVAFEIDDVDRGVFLNRDDQRVAARLDIDGLEQTGIHDALIGGIQLSRGHLLPPPDSGVGHDRRGRDPLIALDHDIGEAVALGRNGAEPRDGSR